MSFRGLRYSLMGLILCLACIANAQQGQSVHIVQGSSVMLRADAANALSYLWFRNGEPLNGQHDQRLNVTGAGTYTVIALGNDCHSDVSDPVEVIVDPGGKPATVDMRIRNEPDRPTALIGTLFSYQLVAINNGNRTANDVVVTATLPANVAYEGVTDNQAGDVTYNPATHQLTWRPGSIAPAQSRMLTITVRATEEGPATQLAVVMSSGTDTNPADNEAMATVNVIALKIPNAFTPNGDGLNDYFRIQGLGFFPENRIVIFNRWGSEVYKASPYRGDWNGSNLAEGTYYYVFEARLHSGRWELFKGYVTIIRTTRE